MNNLLQNRTAPQLDELEQIEAYLLSLSSRLPLNRENRGYLQAFIDAVYVAGKQMGIENEQRLRQIMLGSQGEMASEVRSKAVALIAQSETGVFEAYHDIELHQDPSIDIHLDEMTMHYSHVLASVNPKRALEFEVACRELYCQYAAMLLPSATGLRKFYLDDAEYAPTAIIASFIKKIEEFRDKNEFGQA